MRTLILLLAHLSCIICTKVSESAVLFSPEAADDQPWTEYESLLTDEGQGRAAWTGRSLSSQCGGTVTPLTLHDATVLKSHYSYGLQPYPDNYLCRWLFLPQDCDLGVECAVNTERRLRSSRYRKCNGGDYLRVMGHRGTVDKFFCGHRENVNMTFNGSDAVAFIFRANHRAEERNNEERQAINFGGFSCKIVCKKSSIDRIDEESTVTTTTTQTSTTTATTAPTTTKKTTSKPSKASKLLPCRCGETRGPRIVCPHGHNCTTSLGGVPWQAAIVTRGQSQPWCGGSLLNDRYILTAAHCLRGKKPQRLQVVLGDHDWTTEKDVPVLRYNVIEAKKHPLFDKAAQFDYDFALLKLDRKVSLLSHPGIRPVCLPDEHDDRELLGREGRASGWGVLDPAQPKIQAKRLQSVQVRVIQHEECKRKYRPNPVTENMVCAAALGGDACFGDSGGPFTMQRGRQSVLEGVISWGKSCAKERWPGVYAKVRNVQSWIEENTLDSMYCQNDP